MKKVLSMLLVALMALALAPAAMAAAPVELDFWTVFTGEDGVNMDQLVANFNEANAGIKVNHMKMEADDLYMKAPLAVTAKEGVPDIAIVHAERLPKFVEDGMIMPIDQVMASGKFAPEMYMSAGWNLGDVGGQRYSLPLDVHSWVCYVNLDLLAEYDLDTPVLADGVITWDEVKAVGEKCKDDGITPIGVTWNRPYILSMYYQKGGKLTEDGVAATINNEAMISVLNDLKAMHDAGITSVDGDDPFGGLFVSGMMVFCPEGIWMNNGLKQSDMNYQMALFPQYDAADIKFWASSHQFVEFTKDTTPEKQDAIATFLDYVRHNSMLWAEAGQTVASLELLSDPAYKEMKQAFLADYADKMVVSDYKNYGLVVDILGPMGWESTFGRMTPEEFAQAWQQKVDEKVAAQ
ncbi:extracellular solute-binding protein [Bacillota bacterium Meth-B3]